MKRIDPKKHQLKGKRILVLGLGQSGLACCRFLVRRGCRVTACDEQKNNGFFKKKDSIPASVEVRLKRPFPRPTGYDLIVVSPGVPHDHPTLRQARSLHIPILPEFELGWMFIHPRQTLAVTGTNGKTTTTTLLYQIIKDSGRQVLVGGNIGTPLTALANRERKNAVLVIELSSYQLEAHQNFRANVGVWMNLTPDHLGRHCTMSQYAQIKARLFENSGKSDFAVLNGDDPWIRKMAKGIGCKKIWFPNPILKKLAAHTILPGTHNLENAMAAVASARVLGVPTPSIVKTLKRFKGVKHRIQFIARVRGVSYINDSKGTNIDSTRVALISMPKNVILILGGRHKGSPYTSLRSLVQSKVKRILAIGEAAKIVQRDLTGACPITDCGNLQKAVAFADQVALKNDVVLLSPACASFDQYKNFEERGDHFIHLVKQLK